MSSRAFEAEQPYKIKVSMATPWERKCGVADYSKNLVKCLEELPVDITVIHNNQPNTVNPLYWVKLALKSRRDCNIIHVQHEYSLFGTFWKLYGVMSFIFYLLIWFRRRYKVITTIHELPQKSPSSGLVRTITSRMYRYFSNWFVKASDLVIVHTECARSEIVREYNGVNVVVIPHGSLAEVSIGHRELSKKRLGLIGKHVLVIFGFVNDRKNYEDIISILPELGEDVVLIIAGGAVTKSGELYLRQLRDMARELGVEDRVIFTGYLKPEDVPEIFSAADIVLLPYRDVTQSGVLNIALAYKKAVITSDLPAFREIKDMYDCIEIARDRSEFLSKIRMLLSCKARARKLERKTTRYWTENNWKNVARKHFSVYGEVTQYIHPDEIYNATEQKERLNWIKENASGRVLEVGSATGYVLNYIASSDRIDSCTGIELDVHRTRYSKKRYPFCEFVVGDGRSLPFKDNSFDTVVVSEILEHVEYEHARVILAEACRVGSKVLVTVPVGSWAVNPEHKWIPNEKLLRNLIDSVERLRIREFRKTREFIFCVVEKM